MNQVTIYTSSHCAYCMRAKQLLAQRSTEVREINIDSDLTARSEMMIRSGRHTVPQIFIGNYHVGGFDDLAALDHSGRLDQLL
jgi:glutaredoxin 3